MIASDKLLIPIADVPTTPDAVRERLLAECPRGQPEARATSLVATLLVRTSRGHDEPS